MLHTLNLARRFTRREPDRSSARRPSSGEPQERAGPVGQRYQHGLEREPPPRRAVVLEPDGELSLQRADAIPVNAGVELGETRPTPNGPRASDLEIASKGVKTCRAALRAPRHRATADFDCPIVTRRVPCSLAAGHGEGSCYAGNAEQVECIETSAAPPSEAGTMATFRVVRLRAVLSGGRSCGRGGRQ